MNHILFAKLFSHIIIERRLIRIISTYFLVTVLINLNFMFAQDKGIDNSQFFFEKGIQFYSINIDSSLHFFIRAKSEFKNDSVHFEEKFGYTLLALSTIYNNKENWDSSYYYSMQAFHFVKSASFSNDLELSARNNLAVNYYRKGDHVKAIEIIKDYLYFNDSLGDLDLQTVYNNLGFFYGKLGDSELAKKYYLNSIKEISLKLGEKAEIYKNLGILHAELNEFEIAQKYYLMAIASYNDRIYMTEIDRREFADIFFSLAMTKAKNGEYDSLKYYISRGNSLFEFSNENKMDSWILGNYYLLFSPITECEKPKNELLNEVSLSKIRFSDRPNHPNLTIRYQKLAQAYSLCTQYDSAMYYFQHALRFSAEVDTNQSYFLLPTIEQVRYPHNVIPVLIERGKSLQAWYKAEGNLERLKDAYQSYLLASQLIDRLRKGFRSAGSKLLLSEEAIPTYESAIQLAWQLYQLTGDESYRAQIISLMEQNKASLLLERLKESDIKAQLGVPDSILEKEREVRIDIAYYQKLLYQKTEQTEEADSAKISELRQKIFAREESLRQLQDVLAKDYPDYHKLKYAESVAGLNSIRSQLLESGEMMIEYFWGDSNLIVLGISASDLQYHTVPIAEVEPNLNAFRDILTNRKMVQQHGSSAQSAMDYQKVAFALYQQLLEPIVPRSGNLQHLLVIPDGPLALIPFDLLVASNPENELPFRTMDYLLKNYDFHYAYSATLLIDQVGSREAEHYYAGFAPAYGETDLYAEARDFSPLDSGVRGGFSPLLYNQQEVKQIANQFSGSFWTGKDASEARFKMTAEKYRILHLAMHAFTNDDSPNLSGLVFSPASPNDKTEAEDGILHTYEIYDLDLKADLAVLSACNTGIGRIQKGEGVMSLARAFTYAGCPSLLMSLWQADDEATREIMRLFFEKIEEGHPKSSALQLAKLEFLSQTDRTHPHYWGAFVVIGNNQPLGEGRLWPWALGLGAILLGGVIAYPKFRRAA